MRIAILSIGRARGRPEAALFEEYRRRLAWPVVLQELEERRKLPPTQLMVREAELLLAALPPRSGRSLVVALDRQGEMPGSETFAARLAQWRDRGIAELYFLIGGADGLAPAALARADFRMSLGPMTWPHFLVRVLLAEQLYRAQQILAGHPYHRGGAG